MTSEDAAETWEDQCVVYPNLGAELLDLTKKARKEHHEKNDKIARSFRLDLASHLKEAAVTARITKIKWEVPSDLKDNPDAMARLRHILEKEDKLKVSTGKNGPNMWFIDWSEEPKGKVPRS